MRNLSKVAILGLVATAIGGELFAPPGDPDLGRREFIEKSRTAIGRAWTEAEIGEFQTTHLIPTAIKRLLTEAQIEEFFAAGNAFGNSGTRAKRDYLEALEKLAGK